MKKILLVLLLCINVYPMESQREVPESDDDLELLIRNNHPELHCFRIMEKIDWVSAELDRSVEEFSCKEEYEETMNYWQRRLFNLQAKLKVKEIREP